MMRDMLTLRPEIEALLREVASEPGSALLGVARGRELTALRAEIPVRASDSRLSRAEKHLVEVYREEVAFVLRSAAWRALATSESGRVRIVRGFVHGSSVSVPTEREIAVQASRTMREAHGDEVGVLERLSGPGGAAGSSPALLCAMAQRLVPSANGRILAGIAFTLEGRIDAARTAFVDALAVAPTAELAAAAWENLAELEETSDRWARARAACERAHVEATSLTSPLVGILWFSVRLDDTARALAAMSELEDLVARAPERLDEHFERFVARKLVMKRAWSSNSDRCLRSLFAGATSQVGRLMHALI